MRFYQRAYTNYRQATGTSAGADDALLVDAYYNAVRLLFHVYTTYSNTDGVNVRKLGNVNDVLTGDERSVVQPIESIVEAHEIALLRCLADSSLDTLFNAALVYTEAIEVLSNPPDDYALKAMNLLKEVLTKQVLEFQDFLRIMLEPQLEAPSSGNEAAPEDLQYTSSKTVQPPEIMETINSAYGLAQAILENVDAEQSKLAAAVALLQPFINEVDAVAEDLLQKFSFQNNTNSDLVASIDLEQVETYSIGKASYMSLCSGSLDFLYKTWELEDLPDVSQRYMLAADCVDTLLERFDVSINPDSVDSEVYWGALCKMNIYFKRAQELLSGQLQTARSQTQHEGIGTLIAQLARVYIARSDVDLQRSQLGTDAAQKNSQVLFNNAKAFLKNAMNLAKTTGGIRERAIEKWQRESRRFEAVSRLCVLEGKLDPQELNAIMGEGAWEEYMAGYKEFWYFQRFLQ